MKRMNWTALILVSGLFLASCGGGDQQDSTTEDSTIIDAPDAPMDTLATMPDTVNGIDTTVKVQGNEP